MLGWDEEAGAPVDSLVTGPQPPMCLLSIHSFIYHSANICHSFLCTSRAHGLANKTQPSMIQAVFAHTQSRHWGARTDIQQVVMAVLNQTVRRRQLCVQKWGGMSHRQARVQRPHPRVGKTASGQGDSRGFEAELRPPLSVCRHLGPWAMEALWDRLGPAPEGFRAGEFKP